MLEWFFAIYIMSQYSKVTVQVYLQPTKSRCVDVWREVIEQFRTIHPEVIITSCKEAKGLVILEPSLEKVQQDG